MLIRFRSGVLLAVVLVTDYLYFFNGLSRVAPGQERVLYVVTGLSLAFLVMDILLPAKPKPRL
jgi:hypothetical protein